MVPRRAQLGEGDEYQTSCFKFRICQLFPTSMRLALMDNQPENLSKFSLVPRPHPSAREKGLVKKDNIPGPEARIWESQSDRSICN